MFAVNVSSFGDTIYVANGIYEEVVTMIPGLSLIGAGMDSCVIDTRAFVSTCESRALIMANNCLLKGFHLLVSNENDGTGIAPSGFDVIIEENKISNSCYAIYLINSSSKVANNQILNAGGRGVEIEAFYNDYYPLIENNLITTKGFGVLIFYGTRPTIRNNTIFLTGNGATGYASADVDSAWVYNNLIVSLINSNYTAGTINSVSSTMEYNNFLVGNFGFHGISAGDDNIIKNNVIINSPRGIDKSTGSNAIIQYNNSWNNGVNYINFTPDSTNISVDPMVVNTDTSLGELDFHLQMFSPLIDRGDPGILDKDGSRSDIGLYGGPFGEIYQYQDLPPRAPVNLTALLDTDYILLKWNKNTEADFSHYNLFRDTLGNFTADSTTLVVSTTDSFYISLIPEGADNLYFKLTAVDSQNNESIPSEELHVQLTATNNREPKVISDYRLYQNYPNPFNPTTKIGYKLKERGYVKLYVYDIKGELIQTLVNQYQEGGYYEVEFSGKSSKTAASLAFRLASGIYIYQIMVRNDKNIPVFSDTRKMILLK